MAIWRYLEDGSSIAFSNDTDPNEISRTLREKNLAIKKQNELILKQTRPEYNPGEELEKEDIGTFGSAGRGILNGLVSIPTNIQSTVGYGLQALGQEELGEEVVRRANAIQEIYAPDIEGLGFSADLTKALVQFGLPAGIVFKATQGASKAAQVVALGTGEAVVASEDMESLGDLYIGVGPTLTKDLQHLEGQEKAYQALLNKGKIGLEASAITLGIPKLFQAIGATFSGVAEVGAKVPGVNQTFKAVKDFSDNASKGMDKLIQSSPALDKTLGLFRYRGALPTKEVAEIRDARSVEFAALAFKNQITLDELNNTMSQAFKTGKENGVAEKNIMDALNDYLFPIDDIVEEGSAGQIIGRERQRKAAEILIETDKKLGWLPESKKVNLSLNAGDLSKVADGIDSDFSLFRAAKRARDTIDEYSTRIQKRPEFLPEGAKDTLGAQIGLYGTRQYRAFLDPGWSPTGEQAEKAIEAIKEANRRAGKEVSEREISESLFELTSAKGFLNSSLNPKNIVEDQVLTKVNDGILKGRAMNSQAIRDYLGEYTANPTIAGRKLSIDERKANLMVKAKETMGRQAGIITKGNFIKYLDDYNKTLKDKIFLDFPPPGSQDYEKLRGPGYGPLKDKYVKKSYLQALEKNRDSWYQNVPVLGAAYSSFLGLKGISQMGKTVYNPTGQIRNVTSAMGFAIANGNLPNMHTFSEAWTVVGSNIMKRFPKDTTGKKKFEEYSKRGIVGQQAQLGELNSLIDEAAKAGGATGKLFSSKFMQSTQNNIMTRLYQGGDDIWRIFNYETESQKILSAIRSSQVKNTPFMVRATTNEQRAIAKRAGIRDENLGSFNIFDLKNKQAIKDFAQEEAALITRDVVPNYERVPEIVNMIRRTPFGNFIAYPAEIIRTSANILGQSIKEISSENPYMRARGMERLLGFGAVTTAIPAGAVSVGMAVTGANQEQIAAFKRSFAWPWEKTATLLPVSTDDEGNIKEVINLSYTMPYDYLTRPFAAVQQAVDNGITTEADLNKILFDSFELMYQDMFSPFLGESMITERTLDVFTRNGETRFGTRVWDDNPNIGVGEKVYAGIAHIFNGLIPTISPVKLNPRTSFLKAAESIPGDGSLGEKAADFGFRAFQVGDLPRSVLVESKLVDPSFRVSERGTQVDFFGEMTEAMGGLKNTKLNIETKLRYQAIEAASEVRSASGELQRLRRAYGKRVPEEFLNAYKKANEIRFKALKELSVAVDDAQYLGVKNQEIFRILSEAGVADWENVVNNVFIPYEPPPDIFYDAYRTDKTKVRNVPSMTEMYKDYSERIGQQLSPKIQRPQVVPGQGVNLRLFSDKSEGSQLSSSEDKRASDALRQKEINKMLGLDD